MLDPIFRPLHDAFIYQQFCVVLVLSVCHCQFKILKFLSWTQWMKRWLLLSSHSSSTTTTQWMNEWYIPGRRSTLKIWVCLSELLIPTVWQTCCQCEPFQPCTLLVLHSNQSRNNKSVPLFKIHTPELVKKIYFFKTQNQNFIQRRNKQLERGWLHKHIPSSTPVRRKYEWKLWTCRGGSTVLLAAAKACNMRRHSVIIISLTH
jgi:hypothetical protein